ncbi:hypothetical protein VDG1235_2889 [Verrucomicrobiia bacterium DG1235]|nr:hypothetical protein VDG1235_2889 [Verrucomicrobiae bacterium DG1235]
MRVWRSSRGDLGQEWAWKACQLWDEVWPSSDDSSLSERVDDLRSQESLSRELVAGSEVFHLLDVEGELAAISRSYVREMRFESLGETVPVLALAGVCCSPRFRGKGLATVLVKDAFSRLGEAVPWCLFQTGVPDFYQRLGAFKVENSFVNSRSREGSEASPWWDPFVMVYGDSRNWPEGRVDLLGVAY